jgi:hypothetical protein
LPCFIYTHLEINRTILLHFLIANFNSSQKLVICNWFSLLYYCLAFSATISEIIKNWPLSCQWRERERERESQIHKPLLMHKWRGRRCLFQLLDGKNWSSVCTWVCLESKNHAGVNNQGLKGLLVLSMEFTALSRIIFLSEWVQSWRGLGEPTRVSYKQLLKVCFSSEKLLKQFKGPEQRNL